MKKFTALFLVFVMTLSLFAVVSPSASAEVEPYGTRTVSSDAIARQNRIIARAEEVAYFKWTYKNNSALPASFYEWSAGDKVSSKYYTKGSSYYGLPYSRPGVYKDYYSEDPYNYTQCYVGYSAIDLDGFKDRIENNMSDAFWQAAKNVGQGSVPDKSNYYPGPLYGMDCSSFVSYAWELPTKHTCAAIRKDFSAHGSGWLNDGGSQEIDSLFGYVTVNNVKDAKNFGQTGNGWQWELNQVHPGDAFCNSGHVILVTEVDRNASGNVTRIVTIEATPPRAITGNSYNMLPDKNNSKINLYNSTVSAGVVRRDYDGTDAIKDLYNNKLANKQYGLFRLKVCANGADSSTGLSNGEQPTPQTVEVTFQVVHDGAYFVEAPNASTVKRTYTVGKTYAEGGGFPAVERQGHSFSVWRIDDNTTIAAETTVSANVTSVYATWTPNSTQPPPQTVEVTFKVVHDGAYFVEDPNASTVKRTYTVGKTYAEGGGFPAVERQGHSFSVWRIDDTTTITAGTTVSANVTSVYATWTPNSTPPTPTEPGEKKVDVAFDAGDGYFDGNTNHMVREYTVGQPYGEFPTVRQLPSGASKLKGWYNGETKVETTDIVPDWSPTYIPAANLSTRVYGIDVSHWQGDINWAQVEQAKVEGTNVGYDFAILKLGEGAQTKASYKIKENDVWVSKTSEHPQTELDPKFTKNMIGDKEKNIKGARDTNLDLGCYFMSNAITLEEARAEAQFVINTLKDYKGVFTYPIFYDLERDYQAYHLNLPDRNPDSTDAEEAAGMKMLNDILIEFCQTLEDAGYFCTVYTNWNYLKYFYNRDLLSGTPAVHFDELWYARYPKGKVTPYSPAIFTEPVIEDYPYSMWQPCVTTVSGIGTSSNPTKVDGDICFKDLPSAIISGGYNGFGVSATLDARYCARVEINAGEGTLLSSHTHTHVETDAYVIGQRYGSLPVIETMPAGATEVTWFDANGKAVTPNSTVTAGAKLTAQYNNVLPVITGQPKSVSVELGQSATFKVVATGSNLSYQWEYKMVGTTSWKTWTGRTSPSLTVVGSDTNNGCQYRCVVTNSAGGSVTSSAATLTVTIPKPTITAHPKSVSVVNGQRATLSVVATGSNLSYQWQYMKVGETSWTKWIGKTSASLTVVGSDTNNGCKYRCVVSNTAGKVYSNAATLTVKDAKPTITTQPKSVSVVNGQSTTLSVAATGGNLKYQWQYMKVGETSWTTWSGRTSASLKLVGSDTNNGCKYRCVVSNTAGKVYSNAATLTVRTPKPTITAQPKSVSVVNGQSATLSVAATGGKLTYQWFYLRAGSTDWIEWSGKTSASLKLVGSDTNNGCQYRCIVSNTAASVISNAATLTVKDAKPTITTQPKSVSVVNGQSTTLSVAAIGGNLKYQWQYKKVGETSWTTWSGRTSASLKLVGSDTNNGCKYRCVVSNTAGKVYSSAATLTVKDAKPTITTQPKSVRVAKGQSVTLSVAATGGKLTYQWYYLRAGSTSWTKWSGKTSASLKLVGSDTNNGCKYRCVVSNTAGDVTSNAATLTVS